MMSEHLTVVLITYKRTEYALRTMNGVVAHLQYPKWGWYISDDGSPPDHAQTLLDVARASERELVGWHSQAISYGAGANRGLNAAFNLGELVLMLEDDWELIRPLDVWKWCALLMERPDIGMVRMGYMNSGVSAKLIDHNGSLYWLLDDEHSREHSRFAFAGHPSIIHRRFFDKYGGYPEKWQPGETELRMCWQASVGIVEGGPGIVWPAELGIAGPWGHIGGIQSYEWNGGVRLD